MDGGVGEGVEVLGGAAYEVDGVVMLGERGGFGDRMHLAQGLRA